MAEVDMVVVVVMTSMAEAMEMAMVTNTVLATTMDMAVRTTAMIIMEVVTIRVVGMVRSSCSLFLLPVATNNSDHSSSERPYAAK